MQPADIVIVDPSDCAPALSQLALHRFRGKLTASARSPRIVRYLVQHNEKPPMTGKAGKTLSLIENKFTPRCCSSASGSWLRPAMTPISNFCCNEFTITGAAQGTTLLHSYSEMPS